MRLTWALMLALVVHLVFFLLQLPEREEAKLTIAGSSQVSVRLAHSRPEPVQEKVVPEQEPVPLPAVEPERMEIFEAVDEPVAAPVPPPVEETSDKELQDTGEIQEVAEEAVPVVEEQAAVVVNFSAVDVRKQPVAEPVSFVPAVDGPESVGSTGPMPQAVQQAEPLAADNRPPAYPPLARRRGWQGTVMLEVDVDRDGLVKEVRIQTSSSYSLLDKEAMAAVRKWRFTPGTRNGNPIPSKVLVPVHFVLKEKGVAQSR